MRACFQSAETVCSKMTKDYLSPPNPLTLIGGQLLVSKGLSININSFSMRKFYICEWWVLGIFKKNILMALSAMKKNLPSAFPEPRLSLLDTGTACTSSLPYNAFAPCVHYRSYLCYGPICNRARFEASQPDSNRTVRFMTDVKDNSQLRSQLVGPTALNPLGWTPMW